MDEFSDRDQSDATYCPDISTCELEYEHLFKRLGSRDASENIFDVLPTTFELNGEPLFAL
jgi:hypothetical protein